MTTAATTPTSTAGGKRPGIGGAAHALPVVGQLALRGMRMILRLPSAFVPATLFPIFLIVAFSGAFSAITNLQGFPTDRILNWYVPLAIVQGAAFIGVGVGLGTTRDLENGFHDRILLAPAPRAAILAGPAVGAAARTLLPFAIVLTVGFLGGMRLEGGPVGLLTLLVAAMGTCLLHSLWTLGLAYRLKSQRAAPLMQLGVFLTVFLATAQVPLSVMTGWLKPVATINPMTNVLRLARAGLVGGDGVTWGECWGGVVALFVGVGLTAWWAARGFRKLVP